MKSAADLYAAARKAAVELRRELLAQPGAVLKDNPARAFKRRLIAENRAKKAALKCSL